jgi:hypothetical protein
MPVTSTLNRSESGRSHTRQRRDHLGCRVRCHGCSGAEASSRCNGRRSRRRLEPLVVDGAKPVHTCGAAVVPSWSLGLLVRCRMLVASFVFLGEVGTCSAFGLTSPSTRTHKCVPALHARASCAPVKSDVRPPSFQHVIISRYTENSMKRSMNSASEGDMPEGAVEQALWHAQLIVSAMKENEGVALDYSPDSVRHLYAQKWAHRRACAKNSVSDWMLSGAGGRECMPGIKVDAS